MPTEIRRYTASDTPPYPMNPDDIDWFDCYNNVHLNLPCSWREAFFHEADAHIPMHATEAYRSRKQGECSDVRWKQSYIDFVRICDDSIRETKLNLRLIGVLSDLGSKAFRKGEACLRENNDEEKADFCDCWQRYFLEIRSRLIAPFVVDMIENHGYNEYDLMA